MYVYVYTNPALSVGAPHWGCLVSNQLTAGCPIKLFKGTDLSLLKDTELKLYILFIVYFLTDFIR